MKAISKIVLASLLAMNFSQLALANSTDDIVPRAVVNLHAALDGECDLRNLELAEVYPVGAVNKLYLIMCQQYAYQASYNAYIYNEQSKTARPVMVLAYNETTKGIEPTYQLMEASYAPRTKVLSTGSKGRGLGDCGQTTDTKLIPTNGGDVLFKTFEIRHKSKCDGKMNNWPVVFKQ